MDKKKIDISILKESDIDQVNNFYNSTYKSNRSREEFLWEFFEAPAGKAIYIVAKDAENQKIVGTQCAIPIELITNQGNLILSAKSEDTLVDPNYRGLNIFENMYQLLFEECKKNGIKYIWGFTPAKKPFLKLGFSIPFIQSQSLMVFDVISSYKYLTKLNPKNNITTRIKIMALCILSKISSLKRHLSQSNADINNYITDVHDKTFVQDNSRLIDMAIDGEFFIKLDLPFLTWRLAKNPNHKKIVNIYFSSGSKTVAYIAFNYHKDGVWYLITDSYASEINFRHKSHLFNKAVNILVNRESNDLNLIRTFDFTHNDQLRKEVSIRQKAGFIHIDRGVAFVWKSLDESNTLDPMMFHLSRISTQGVI